MPDDIRAEALRHAVAAYRDAPYEDIVKAAEAFLAFLRGETARVEDSLEQLIQAG